MDYTREVEETLDLIAQGQAKGRELLAKAYTDLQETLGTMPAGEGPSTEPCPVEGCGGYVRRLESQKKPGTHFWACSNRAAHGLLQDADEHPGKPFEERQARAPEAQGPGCPKCKQPTGQFTTSTGKPYYRCQKCSTTWCRIRVTLWRWVRSGNRWVVREERRNETCYQHQRPGNRPHARY